MSHPSDQDSQSRPGSNTSRPFTSGMALVQRSNTRDDSSQRGSDNTSLVVRPEPMAIRDGGVSLSSGLLSQLSWRLPATQLQTIPPDMQQIRRFRTMSRERQIEELSRMKREMMVLETQLATSNSRERTLKDELTESERRNTRLDARNEELKTQLETLSSQYQALKEAHDVARQENSVLKEEVKQQKTTISVQSKTLERTPNPETPRRNTAIAYMPMQHGQAMQQGRLQFPGANTIYNQAPPAYNPYRGPSVSSSAPYIGLLPAPTQGYLQYPHIRQEDNLMGILFRDNDSAPPIDFTAEFHRIFSLSETWARNHANVPDSRTDSNISQNLKTDLSAGCTMDVARSLVSSSGSRYFAVSKVVNTWLTREILTLGAIQGFDAYIEAEVKRCYDVLSCPAPEHERRAKLTAAASYMVDLKQRSGFQPWLDTKSTTLTGRIFGHLHQLVVPGAVDAAKDLRHIVSEAYRLGVEMASVPMTWEFNYPEYGRRFDPSGMLNKDPAVGMSPTAIQKAGFKVRLAVSPSVGTTYYNTESLVPRCVRLADVLLME